MKKFLFFGAMVALLLGTAACSSDIEPVAGDEALVTFTVNLGDGIDSRTISDGNGANIIKFAVYTEDGQHISALDQTVAVENKMATIQTRLTRYHNFKLVFWAQNSSCSAYNTDDMSAIKVDYTTVNCNDESRDAFYKMEEVSVANADVNRLVVLTRPFAQINFLANDAAGVVNVNQYKSKVTVTGVPTTLNTLDGSVADFTDVTFDYATILPNEETLASYEQYRYVAMNYVLAATAKEMKNEVVLTVKDENNAEVNTVTVANCPVQRNYRTNIIGDLFTMEGKFNIEIDPIYEGEFNLPEKVWDGETRTAPALVDGVYTITNENEMAYVFQNIDNLSQATKVVIAADLNMGLHPFNGIGQWETPNADLTIDGQNHTIKGMVETLLPFYNKSYALEIKDLTITDSQIEYDLNSADNTHVGAFVGWIGEAWTSVNISNCHLTNSSVKGSDQNGGIFGYATGSNKTMNVTDCSVENCEIWSKENCAPLCGNGTAGGGTLIVTNFKSLNNTVTSEKTGGPEKLRAGSVIATVSTGTVKFYNLTAEGNTVTAGGNVMTTIYGRYIGGSIYIDDVLLTH